MRGCLFSLTFPVKIVTLNRAIYGQQQQTVRNGKGEDINHQERLSSVELTAR